MKKVLFFINSIPPDYGGGYLRAYRMAVRLKKHGRFGGIITLTNKKKYINHNQLISSNDISFLNCKILIPIAILISILKRRKLFDTLYIVSIQWYTFIAVIIAKLLNKNILLGITLSGVDSPSVHSNNYAINLYYKIKNLQFKLANRIIVNSPALVNECVAAGLKKQKVIFIPNPVDIDKFYPVNDKREQKRIRKKIGIPEEEMTILFVGSVNKRKGADLFPRIFQQINESEYCKCNFIICGDLKAGESEKILKDIGRVFTHNNNKLLFFEKVNNVNDFMRASDIFIFPTTNEGLPNVILEAMSTGLIIFSNILPGITDYLLPDRFLVPNNDTNLYAKRISDVINQNTSYKREIHENILKIERDFLTKNIDDKFISLL